MLRALGRVALTQQWSVAMQSFLMSQGQWKCTKNGAEAPNTTTTITEVEGGPSTSVMSGPLYPSALNVFVDSSRS